MNIASIFTLFARQDDGGAETSTPENATNETPDAGAEAAADATAAAEQEWLWEEHNGSYFFPEQASDFGKPIDSLYDLIFWVSMVFFILIVGAMVYFVVVYRKRPGYVQQKSPSHNTVLEVAWSVIPSLILVLFFIKGVWGFMDMRVAPDETYTIKVYAKQWSWRFVYPDGEESDVLHIPKNTPVRFVMQSEDVIHSWYVPAFRQKWDIVPGRYGTTWVNATQEGEYRLYCTEYCGDSHSTMRTYTVVHDLSWKEMMDKIRWRYPDHSAEENGERLYKIKGCNGCHSVDGTAKTGPTFQGQFGTERDYNGGTVKMDEEYIRESILNPAAKIRSGFANQMPTFQGKLSNEEIDYLIAYIESKK